LILPNYLIKSAARFFLTPIITQEHCCHIATNQRPRHVAIERVNLMTGIPGQDKGYKILEDWLLLHEGIPTINLSEESTSCLKQAIHYLIIT